MLLLVEAFEESGEAGAWQVAQGLELHDGRLHLQSHTRSQAKECTTSECRFCSSTGHRHPYRATWYTALLYMKICK